MDHSNLLHIKLKTPPKNTKRKNGESFVDYGDFFCIFGIIFVFFGGVFNMTRTLVMDQSIASYFFISALTLSKTI